MIFNKNAKGTQELRQHAGFLYASVEFDNIAPDVLLVQEDLAEVISPGVMSLAETHYLSDNYLKSDTNEHKLLDKLVEHIQLPITLYAIHSFQKLTDVSHEETGRKMKLQEGEKIPFEWLLERDDKAILSRAHKTTDRLLAFLDNNIDNAPIKNVWGTSDAYKETKRLFINTASEFDKVYPINKSRRFFIKISSFIAEVERKQIRPIIGSTRFEALKEKIIDKDLESADKDLLNLIRVPLVMWVMQMAVERLSVDILPNGIFQNFEAKTQKASKPINSDLRAAVISHFKRAGVAESAFLQTHITGLSGSVDTAPTIDYSKENFLRL